MMHAAVWDVALSEAEIVALYNGGVALPAYYVRPENLVFFAPLYEDDGDIDWRVK